MRCGRHICCLPAGLVLALATGACGGGGSPSDDPGDYQVDTSVSYEVQLSAPRWVVPSAALPAQAQAMTANNNVDIVLFDGRLLMAWRTAQTHFASSNVKMHVVSSPDMGESWDHEQTIAINTDVREPRFLVAKGRLLLYWFEAGSTALAFDPRRMWRCERLGRGRWSAAQSVGLPREVPWTIKWRGDRAYISSYAGNHYDLQGPGKVDVRFQVSADGLSWGPLEPGRTTVYHGGVSEAAFELDHQGGLWAVTRNEDGDDTGFGSHLCSAPAGNLARWSCPRQSDPERYDSPWMFRHGVEIYLVARRDVGGPFDQGLTGLTFAERKARYLSAYSLRAKRTALYRVDRAAHRIVHLRDLPSAGDTAFPSVRRTGTHSFILANYSSPLDDPDIGWLKAQVSPRGTGIYLMDLTFVPRR
jgi:hypothetical protein